MAFGPVSGKDGIEVFLPPNKICHMVGITQAAYKFNLRVEDSNGKVIFHENADAPPASTNIEPYCITKWVSTKASPYKVYITVNNGEGVDPGDTNVIWGDLPLNIGTTLKSEVIVLTAEDKVDTDYNDLSLIIGWWATEG